jgi:zinc protease
VGAGTVLSVAGSFDPDRLIPRIEAFLLRIPKGSALGAGPAFAGPAQVGDFVEKQPREQAVVLEGFPGAALDAPDFYAGELLDELFSGMASRLFERVREQKGLAYFVRSGRTACRSTAMFYFMAGTQPGKEREVLDEIAIEIARVQAGQVTAEELRRCQVRLKAGHRKALQTNASRAMQAAVDVLHGRGANHWKGYDSLIDAVTIDDLSAFARAHFQASRRTQLVVRP